MLQEVLERLVAAVKQLASLATPFGASNAVPEATTGLGTGTPRALGLEGKDKAKAVMHAVNGLALGATALLVASQRCTACAFCCLSPSRATKSLPVSYVLEAALPERWPRFHSVPDVSICKAEYDQALASQRWHCLAPPMYCFLGCPSVCC